MEKRKSSFDDHMSVVETHKTAGLKNDQESGSLLERIAGELGLGLSKEAETGSITAPAAPAAEGEVSPAESSVAGAAAPVAAATDAVTVPQTAIAGGNEQEAQAGEVPATTKPNEGLAISAGDGKVTDANNINKTPEAVAAAAVGGGGDEASAATPSPEVASAVPDQSIGAEKTAEAVSIGKVIAASFQEELAKQASDRDYSESLGILKEAGLLDSYKINDEGINKTASVTEGGLEKIANKQAVSREDIISAAVEYVELSKEAELAEEQGRQDARKLVAQISENKENEKVAEDTKVAEAIQDPEVVAAMQVLKKKNIL